MNSYWETCVALARDTLRDPRQAARQVLALDLPREVVWSLLGLVAVGSLAATLIGDRMLPQGTMAMMPFLTRAPILGALFLAAAMVILSAVLSRLGQLFGGAGTFDQALRLIVWSQILMLALQLLQTVFIPISPTISALIGLVGFVWFIWLAAAFTAELHAFDGAGKGLVVAVLSVFVTAFALMILMVMLGIKPMVEAANV
ncbi:Yip1 family protein [Actibacterium ureilyticum]|uniref:Yip1 family protein n=1 Tax=Actibacterium ureilyticum TaxID=1590614 RepID=UPI001595E9D1|nr:Yip1 family protein [Actibacterium ureilyticum]